MKENLPIEPFQIWLRKKIVSRYGSVHNMSECLGFSSKKLDSYLSGRKPDRRLKNRDIKDISIGEVDAVVCSAGDHISDIYPEYYDL